MQTWNDLLKYIKRKVGSPLSLLELTDDDIFDIVRTFILPKISQIIGKPFWIRVSSANLAPRNDVNFGEILPNTYKLPIPKNVIIVDIQEVYYNRDDVGVLGMYKSMIGVLDPRDTVMTNTFQDMLESLDTVQSFDWIPPDKVTFSEHLGGRSFICECKAVHNDLKTIPSDVYYDIVLPLTLAEIYEDLVEIRSKYSQLNTPFGPVELNWQRIEQRATELRQSVNEKLDSMPPDHLITIF